MLSWETRQFALMVPILESVTIKQFVLLLLESVIFGVQRGLLGWVRADKATDNCNYQRILMENKDQIWVLTLYNRERMMFWLVAMERRGHMVTAGSLCCHVLPSGAAGKKTITPGNMRFPHDCLLKRSQEGNLAENNNGVILVTRGRHWITFILEVALNLSVFTKMTGYIVSI